MEDQNNQHQVSNDTEERPLSAEQLKELTDGMAIRETLTTSGWKIIEGWLKSRSFHSWVDPRGLSKDEWEWAELNAFHSADVAKQLLADIQEAIDKADQIENYRAGKLEPKKMKI